MPAHSIAVIMGDGIKKVNISLDLAPPQFSEKLRSSLYPGPGWPWRGLPEEPAGKGVFKGEMAELPPEQREPVRPRPIQRSGTHLVIPRDPPRLSGQFFFAGHSRGPFSAGSVNLRRISHGFLPSMETKGATFPFSHNGH